jgi:hypothetical protein
MKQVRTATVGLVALLLVLALVPAASAQADAAGSHGHPAATRENVSWWWDADTNVGVSKLVRTQAGLRAALRVDNLTPGDAVTLWVIVFNNPEACSTSPCSVPADVFNEAAGADFYWADGAVVGLNGEARLRGSLHVGQTAYSGKAETGLAEPVPLMAPRTAEVVLAVHSHGPALAGAELEAQLTSYTGGCAVFNGPDGFAGGFEDLPDEVGECSTIQGALHQASG